MKEWMELIKDGRMLFSSLYTQGSWGGCHGVKKENLYLDLIDLDVYTLICTIYNLMCIYNIGILF